MSFTAEQEKSQDFRLHLAKLRHDLVNPIGVIQNACRLTIDDAKSAGREELMFELNAILTSSENLQEVVAYHLGSGTNTITEEDIDWDEIEYLVRSELNQIDGHTEIVKAYVEENPEGIDPEDIDEVSTAAREVLKVFRNRDFSETISDFMNLKRETENTLSTIELFDAYNDKNSDKVSGTILIVDDSPTNRRLLSRQLERQGFSTVGVSSGKEAIKTLEENDFDLIMLDLLMPEISGAETLARIRRRPAWKTIPIIMLTGIDDSREIIRCILSGADDYVLKPFNPVLLRARIGAAIEKHRLRESIVPEFRVFISSPVDVVPERKAARKVIERINKEMSQTVRLVPEFWEDNPMLATETFQTQINSPRSCDIFLGVFWSKLGSRLPSDICRDDGTIYNSGSEYEFEQAYYGHRESGKPHILVYRKTAVAHLPFVAANGRVDRNAVHHAMEQWDLLEDFIDRWFKSDDGSYSGAFHSFEDADDFESTLYGHLRKLVMKFLDDNPS